MRALFYIRYPLQAVFRGGQRALAIFCIAVGVTALTALQLAGVMVQRSLVEQSRLLNGGDLTVATNGAVFLPDDAAYFEGLRHQGLISAWTPIEDVQPASAGKPDGRPQPVILRAVEPGTYPLTGEPALAAPPNRHMRALLAATGSAVTTESLAAELGLTLGQKVIVGSRYGPVQLTLAGIVPDSGIETAFVVYISRANLEAAAAAANAARPPIELPPGTVVPPGVTAPDGTPIPPGATLPPGTVAPDGSTPPPVTIPAVPRADVFNRVQLNSLHVAAAIRAIRTQFPKVTTQTTADVLDRQSRTVAAIRGFLQISGLLAILISGIGILNTMQVLLARRRVEIVVLKSIGYRRGHLYLLFGIEAAVMGLIGGVLGAAAGVGLSYAAKSLLENVLIVHLAFEPDRPSMVSGALVGLFATVVFALIPIVRAAEMRPKVVAREIDETPVWRTRLTTGLLSLLVVAAFTVLAWFVLGNLYVAVIAVSAAVAVMAGLYAVFASVVWVIGSLPVPERVTGEFLLIVTAAVAASALVFHVLPGAGIPLLVFTLTGYLIVFLPRPIRVSFKLAFRSLGRQRARTAATLVALFVGLFSTSALLLAGQDVKDELQNGLLSSQTFNVFAITNAAGAARIDSALKTIPGLRASFETDGALVEPTAVDGVGFTDYLRDVRARSPQQKLDIHDVTLMISVSGVDLSKPAQGTVAQDLNGVSRGRLLTPADAGTANVVAPAGLLNPAFRLHVGSHVTVQNAITGLARELVLVGFYSDYGQNGNPFGQLTGDMALEASLGGAIGQHIVALDVDPAQEARALRVVTATDPTAVLYDVAGVVQILVRFLTNIFILLASLSSLALIAGLVIIANAVALAMHERKREIGILKAVGYQARSVLGYVLLENVIVGATGGLIAMAVVTLAAFALGRLVLHSDVAVGSDLTLAVIVGAALIAVITAALVAWTPAHVRPAQVLRYE